MEEINFLNFHLTSCRLISLGFSLNFYENSVRWKTRRLISILALWGLNVELEGYKMARMVDMYGIFKRGRNWI